VANPSKCRPTRLFDILMPLALPFRNHPKCTALFPGNAYSTRPSDKPPLKNTSKRNWARSLKRRNQASQTIILDLSQCSLRLGLPLITRKIFPSKIRQKYRFPGWRGLTAELPAVGTCERPHRNLIRAGDGGLGGAEFAWELPSRRRHFRISPPAQATQASRGTDPDGAFEMHGKAGSEAG